MSECFVDLSYRGLSLGRRIKLTRVEVASGYLETPAPMPVGTAIAIATDDGLTLEAIVTEVREQVGGATVAPGMQVAPKLEGEATEWWNARISAVPEPAPEEPTVATAPIATPTDVGGAAAPEAARRSIVEPPVVAAATVRPERVTVRPRSQTVQTPPPEWQSDLGKAAAALAESMAAVPQAMQDNGATTVMPAVDPSLYADDTRATMPQTAISDETRTSGAYAIVDDGKRTIAMTAIDPAALGLIAPSDDDTDVGAPSSDDKKPGGNGGGKKRRTKKRG